MKKKIYRNIENVDSWEGVIKVIFQGLKPYTKGLIREITQDDVVRLTDIKIKRISKYDLQKENDKTKQIEVAIKKTKTDLKNITNYCIEYFKNLKKKYGKDKSRKTEERLFDTIVASKVAIANKKLYANREEGFIGTSLRKDEYILECSDIDDIIIFRRNAKMLVTKVSNKVFCWKRYYSCWYF